MAYRGSDNELAGQQAVWAIEGGAQYAMELIANATTPGQLPEKDTYDAEAIPVGEASFWLLGGAGDDNTYTSTTPVFGLVDEASRINLNTASADLLAGLPWMTEELAYAILDWRDSNDEVNAGGGAESETYALRRPAYAAKNGPFESVEELALVNGATFEILYGEDANQNGILDPNEDDGDESAPSDNSDGKLEPGILQYLTCFSRQANKASDGTSPRINVAKPSDELTLFLNVLSPDTARDILTNLAVGATPTTWKVGSVMEFYIKSQMTADQLGQIINDIWIAPSGEKQYVEGLININTASETVLACIPGILTEKAGAVVAARTQRQQGDSSIAWLRDVLGDEGALLAGKYITGRTNQFSADVAAVGRHGRGYRRVRFVIDNSTGTPRVIYRRDLSSLGWGLGALARQDLASRKGETAP
jgi:type II secretory pathway component PulK